MTAPDCSETLIDRLVTGDASGLRSLVDLSGSAARTTRERQLLAIARAHLDGRADLLDALIRDHLVDHPDRRLAAWLTTPHPDSRSNR